ncbi:hypothetical protein U9M48_022497 [Paspalum notatum var. saurae]
MITPDWGMTVYGPSRTDDDVSFSGTVDLPQSTGDTHELTPVVHSPAQESGNVYLLLASAYSQEDEPGVDEDMYEKFQDPCTEAKPFKDEAEDKSNKIHKTEMDLLSALQRVSFV